MNPRSPAIRSAKLSRLRREIERWRKSPARGSRMPEELWTSAAELAREHGHNRIASALRLDYYSLKKRLERTPSGPRSRRKPSASFVEISLPGATRSPGCIVELEHPGGMKLRVTLEGMPELTELETVAAALWRSVE